MYGPLKRGDSIVINSVKISLFDSEDGYIYHRVSPWGELRKRLVGVNRLEVHPAPPIYLPIPGLFTHLYIPLKPEIYVDKDSEADIVLKVIPDVAVSHVDKTVRYIDIIPLKTPKMAAYGGPADGILSRYMFPVQNEEASLSIPLKIINKCGEPVSISKVVFPIAFLKLFYRDGSLEAISNKIYVELECDVAIISPGDEPDIEGLKEAPQESTEVLMDKLGIDVTSFKKMFNVDKTFIMDRGL